MQDTFPTTHVDSTSATTSMRPSTTSLEHTFGTHARAMKASTWTRKTRTDLGGCGSGCGGVRRNGNRKTWCETRPVKAKVLARAPKSSFSDDDGCYVRGADGLPLEAEWSPICEHRGLAPVLYVEQVMSTPAKALHEDMTLEKALHYFMKEKISGCPVVNDQDELVGVLSMTDLIWHEAAAEAHGTKHWAEEAEKILHGTVKDEMNRNLVTVGPYELVSEAAKTMLANHVSRLPVVVQGEGGALKMMGIITRLDVMRCMAATLVDDE